MTIVKVGDKRIKFPDSMSKEEIKSALGQKFGTQQTKPLPDVTAQQAGTVEEQILSIPGMKPIAELAARTNKSLFQVLDFFGPDNVNAVLELAGSDSRVPTFSGELASDGGYMDEGLARDVVQATGEVVPMALGVGQALRTVAGKMPATAAASESAAKGTLRQMGQSTIKQDAAAGALAATGGEIGEEVGGANGKLIGSALLPIGAGIAASKAAQVKSAIQSKGGSELVEQGKDAGIPILTTDAVPPKSFPGKIAQQTAEKIPLAGTAPVRAAQQQMRVKAVDDVAQKYGEYSYDAIVSSLKTQKNKVKSAAGAVLNRVGSQLDEVGHVPTPATKKAINNALAEFEKQGVIQSSNAGDDLKTLIKALETPQTFTTLKENGTAFREIVKSTDKADRSQLTSRAKSLLERVQGGIREDMAAFARQNLDEREFTRWQKANGVYAREAQELTKTKLKNVLDKGDVTPESVERMLFSQKPSEQRALYQSLTKEGRDNARAAIISKVVNNVSKRASGLTPNSFVNELKKYDSHIQTFFKGDERRRLEGLRRVLEATTRAQDAAATTPTGQQLIGGLSVTGLYLDPVATVGTAGTVGALARIYETAPVRTALLRLGSAPKNSDKYLAALADAQIAFHSAAKLASDSAEAKESPQ